MGFMSKLKKLIGQSDDAELSDAKQKLFETMQEPQPSAMFPKPSNIMPGGLSAAADGGVAPPIPAPQRLPAPMPITASQAPIAPPNRLPVQMNEAPPLDLSQMESAFKNQPYADYSQATEGATATGFGNPTFQNAGPIAPPSRITSVPDAVMTPDAAPIAAPMRRVQVGETYEGMTPNERAQARLRTLRGADPMSKVKDTGTGYEVEPPSKLGRLKAMGKGFLMRMAAGRQYGLGGMLGAGAVGVAEGGISPGRIQNLERAGEIAAAEGEQARTGQLEEQDLQNDTRRLQNQRATTDLSNAEEDRTRDMDQQQRVEYFQGLNQIGDLQKQQSMLDPASTEYANANAAIAQEAERLSKRTGRQVTVIPGNPKLNQLPKMAVDGQIIQQDYDGKWKPVFGEPKSDNTDQNYDEKSNYEWQVKNTENEAKRAAAIQEATALEGIAANHQQKVSETAAKISALDDQMKGMGGREPALGPLKRQRAQLEKDQASQQKAMEDAYAKAHAKKADAAAYPAIPPPPKRTKRAAAGAGGQALSESAWKNSHKGGDWNAAVAAATERRIPIIP